MSTYAETAAFMLPLGDGDRPMSTPQTQISKALEEALAQLRRDPSRPVRAHLDELDVELRAVPPSRRRGPGLGTRMAALGPWQGESTEEIIRILREGRETGGSAEPPEEP
jgi:hypothetical protein